MLNNIFKGIFDSELASVISVSDFLTCIVSALIIGLILALCHMYKTRYTKSFVATLALLPAVVCVVIMMVNGNIGTAVAVAGTFGLVRFRSAAGTAKEISAIFLAMATGLVVGMGYIAYGFLCAIIFGVVSILYASIDFGIKKRGTTYKTLHVTIPEDLDYTDVFEDLFKEYTSSYDLTHVKTTNMGSLYRLTYDIVLRDASREKEFIDKIRCRNGNLEISISKQETQVAEL